MRISDWSSDVCSSDLPEVEDPLSGLDLAGPFGRMLSAAGIEAAITGSDGIVTAASAGFAERAAGDAKATLAGPEFVSFLRTAQRARNYFARAGGQGPPPTAAPVPPEHGRAYWRGNGG